MVYFEEFFDCSATIDIDKVFEQVQTFQCVVFLQALSNIEVPGRRYLDSSIADVLRNIQRMIYHEEKMLMHYCSSKVFSKHLSQAYNDFGRAKRKYLSSINYGDSEEDEDDDPMSDDEDDEDE